MVVVGPHCRKTWQSKLDKEALLLGTFIVFEIRIIISILVLLLLHTELNPRILSLRLIFSGIPFQNQNLNRRAIPVKKIMQRLALLLIGFYLVCNDLKVFWGGL